MASRERVSLVRQVNYIACPSSFMSLVSQTVLVDTIFLCLSIWAGECSALAFRVQTPANSSHAELRNFSGTVRQFEEYSP